MTNRTRGRRRRARGGTRWTGLFVLAALLLAGCRQEFPQNTLAPAGPEAQKIDDLFIPVFWIAVGVFVVVEGLLVFAAIWFRRRPGRENPVQVHGNTRLEVIWTMIPAVILAVIAVPTVRVIFDLARVPEGPDVVNVRVIGHQWWWEFEYPDLDVVTANELHIPVGRPVALTLESDETPGGLPDSAIPVIHSFWVPRLGGKQDMIPGRTNHLTLQADEPGMYHGQCAEFCGLSHANMRFRVIAQTPEEFDQWVASMQAPAVEPQPGTLEAEGADLFENFGTGSCLACHTLDGQQGAMVGPNLARFGIRRTLGAGLFDNTDENLARWLDHPRAMKPGVVMPDYGLTEDQIEALVAYLRSQQ